MISSGPVPWYNRPAREYPIKRWLRERYGFNVSPLAFAWQVKRSSGASQQRLFPAKRWMLEQQGVIPQTLRL